jgi:hypothetical protein
MSDNLSLPQVTENQANPEVPINDATAKLGEALTEMFGIDLTSGNVTVTSDQYRRNIHFRAHSVATGGRTVTFPAVQRGLILFECDSANTNTIGLIVGSTTLTLSPGRLYLVRTDGTTNDVTARDVGGTSEPMDIAAFIPGVMSNAQLLLRYMVLRAFSIPTNAAGSYVKSSANATADTTITFKKNGASFGTSTIPTGDDDGAHTVTATSFAVGDILSIEGPATADATVADVAISLKGSR